MRRSFIGGVLSIIATLVPAALAAQGWIIPRPCGIGIFPADGRTPPITSTRDCRPSIARTASDVRVELADRVLRYEVDERFVNRGPSIGEADYLFPLPNGAAFEDLKLSINGQLVAGEALGAADARRIYESIVRAQRDPALVEWVGHGLVRARVFPINPGEEKRVVIRFQTVAPHEGDALRVDYSRGANGGNTAASTFSLGYRASPELGNPYSPTHQLDVSDRDGRRRVTVRGDASDLTLLIPVRQAAGGAISVLPYSAGNEDGFALFTITPPIDARRSESTPRDITLVVDVSGSMSGKKIEQARAAGHQLLATLRPVDRFRIIDFSSDVRSFRDDFVSATQANISDAYTYLDALEASGGTNIEGALREVTRTSTERGRLPLVLFVTDGEPTIGERSPERLAALASESRSAGNARRIFTFGLGSDVNVTLLEQLALEGRGTSQFVRPEESVERAVGVVASRLADPVVTDARVRIEGSVRLSRMLPSQSADIFADRDLVVLARYAGHGPARVIIEGTRRGQPVRWESTINFPDRDRTNPSVARLWATQRIGYLTAEKHKNGASTEIDDEIKSLGERFGIPTEFTSYLVTEPRMAALRNSIGALSTAGAAAAPAMAPAARDYRFESAKAAAAQRAATNVAAFDSIAGSNHDLRRIGDRTFLLREGRWTDQRYKLGALITRVKPYSPAYFRLLSALPELRAIFALGDRVLVAGKSQAIQLTDDGTSELSRSALDAIINGW
jgi:Ca-activated chloride channel family protein